MKRHYHRKHPSTCGCGSCEKTSAYVTSPAPYYGKCKSSECTPVVYKDTTGYVMEAPSAEPSYTVPYNKKKSGYSEVSQLTIKASLEGVSYVKPYSHSHDHDHHHHHTDGSAFYIMARKNNKVVTVSWHSIEAVAGYHSLSKIKVAANINNLPAFVVNLPVIVAVNDRIIPASLEVDPSARYPLSFIVHTLRDEGIKANDLIKIFGGCVSWIESDVLPCRSKDSM
jgi:hypothetical protein